MEILNEENLVEARTVPTAISRTFTLTEGNQVAKVRIHFSHPESDGKSSDLGGGGRIGILKLGVVLAHLLGEIFRTVFFIQFLFIPDADFLLTVGSFLLTVELFYLQLTTLSFCLQLELFPLTISVFCLQLELFAYSGKVRLRSVLWDCKQRSLTVSKKTKDFFKEWHTLRSTVGSVKPSIN